MGQQTVRMKSIAPLEILQCAGAAFCITRFTFAVGKYFTLPLGATQCFLDRADNVGMDVDTCSCFVPR